MKKIVSIVGARPQFIKLAPLSKNIRKNFKEIILHTGQHYDNNMSGKFFEDLEISMPYYNLNVGASSHAVQTGSMMIGIEKILLKEKPDLVIIFGDTNSTLAGALTASKMRVPLVHVESGLRSFNKEMPEELNRIISDHVSDFLFAPTETSVFNLDKENLTDKTYHTGDIMVDALQENLKKALDKSNILSEFNLKMSEYYLLTLHRPYNVDSPKKLEKIIKMISGLNKSTIFPVHPRTIDIIKKNRIIIPESIKLSDPVGYLDFLALQYNSFKIITDSGGVQKEAYILKKPCITLRSETEWVETVEDGWNILVDPESALESAQIHGFNPNRVQTERFGNNVAEKMMKIIRSVI